GDDQSSAGSHVRVPFPEHGCHRCSASTPWGGPKARWTGVGSTSGPPSGRLPAGACAQSVPDLDNSVGGSGSTGARSPAVGERGRSAVEGQPRDVVRPPSKGDRGTAGPSLGAALYRSVTQGERREDPPRQAAAGASTGPDPGPDRVRD